MFINFTLLPFYVTFQECSTLILHKTLYSLRLSMPRSWGRTTVLLGAFGSDPCADLYWMRLCMLGLLPYTQTLVSFCMLLLSSGWLGCVWITHKNLGTRKRSWVYKLLCANPIFLPIVPILISFFFGLFKYGQPLFPFSPKRLWNILLTTYQNATFQMRLLHYLTLRY